MGQDLSKICKTQPHAAFAALTHGMMSKCSPVSVEAAEKEGPHQPISIIVCNEVCVEPDLQAISSALTTHQGYSAANGLQGGRLERTFMDVRVFNPDSYASSNRNIPALKMFLQTQTGKEEVI